MLNFNFEHFNYFSSKWIPNGARLFLDWDMKKEFYKQEPLVFIKHVSEFLFATLNYLSKSEYKEDRKAAMEVLEVRKWNIMKDKFGYDKFSKEDYENEAKKLKLEI